MCTRIACPQSSACTSLEWTELKQRGSNVRTMTDKDKESTKLRKSLLVTLAVHSIIIIGFHLSHLELASANYEFSKPVLEGKKSIGQFWPIS